ncbi:MAG: hypothetical protein COZ08_04570, partial [Bacteroidetes bacterium CG_4_10_14_3_um_filter_42_6]
MWGRINIITTIVVIQAVICGILSAFVAHSKNRDGVWWFWIGLIFGFLGLLAASGVTEIKEDKTQ